MTIPVWVIATLSVVSVAVKVSASAVVHFTVNVTTPEALLAPDGALIIGEPLPVAFVRLIIFPDTGLLFVSFRVTVMVDVVDPSPTTVDGEADTVDVDALTVPAVPVAVNVTGEPVRLPLVAVRVFDPAVVPSVQLPTVAMPDPFVVAVNVVAEPPPVATAKVTLTPDTGLLLASLTITLGAVNTAEPTVAL